MVRRPIIKTDVVSTTVHTTQLVKLHIDVVAFSVGRAKAFFLNFFN